MWKFVGYPQRTECSSLKLYSHRNLPQASPDVVNAEQRQAAQDHIMAFRKTRMPYAQCQYILGMYLNYGLKNV